MSIDSEIQTFSSKKLKDDEFVPFQLALERLTEFATRYMDNTVFEDMQSRNRKRPRKEIPSVQQAELALDRLNAKILQNINSLARISQMKK